MTDDEFELAQALCEARGMRQAFPQMYALSDSRCYAMPGEYFPSPHVPIIFARSDAFDIVTRALEGLSD